MRETGSFKLGLIYVVKINEVIRLLANQKAIKNDLKGVQ